MEAVRDIDLVSLSDTLISLSAAFILGGVTGLERQYRQRTAGLRTNVGGRWTTLPPHRPPRRSMAPDVAPWSPRSRRFPRCAGLLASEH